jgi:hypothetical protein
MEESMKKIYLGLLSVTLLFCIYGCNKKLDQNVLTFEYENNITTVKDGHTILLNENTYELGKVNIQLGMVETDNDGVVWLVNNEKYNLTITLDPYISGDNIKVYYNNAIINLSSYSLEFNEYSFDFTSAPTKHNIKIEGISKDLKRKMSVSLPIPEMQYRVFHKNSDGNFYQINADNNNFEVDYGSNLVFKITMTIAVFPSWNIGYTKEGAFLKIASEDETIENTTLSKTFSIKVDSNILKIELFDIEPI